MYFPRRFYSRFPGTTRKRFRSGIIESGRRENHSGYPNTVTTGARVSGSSDSPIERSYRLPDDRFPGVANSMLQQRFRGHQRQCVPSCKRVYAESVVTGSSCPKAASATICALRHRRPAEYRASAYKASSLEARLYFGRYPPACTSTSCTTYRLQPSYCASFAQRKPMSAAFQCSGTGVKSQIKSGDNTGNRYDPPRI